MELEKLNNEDNMAKNVEFIYKERDILVDRIKENPDNEKIFNMKDIESLASSIKQAGFIGAIDVFDLENGYFEVFSGHRRLRAAKSINLPSIPCRIYPNVSEKDKAERLIDLNIFNRNITPMDYARAIDYYTRVVLGLKKTRNEAEKNWVTYCAEHFKKSESMIRKYSALLSLIPELQELAEHPDIPFSALAEAKNLNENEQRELYADIIKIQKENEEITLTRPMILNMIQTVKRKKKNELIKSIMQESSKKGSSKENVSIEAYAKAAELSSIEEKELYEECLKIAKEMPEKVLDKETIIGAVNKIKQNHHKAKLDEIIIKEEHRPENEKYLDDSDELDNNQPVMPVTEKYKNTFIEDEIRKNRINNKIEDQPPKFDADSMPDAKENTRAEIFKNGRAEDNLILDPVIFNLKEQLDTAIKQNFTVKNKIAVAAELSSLKDILSTLLKSLA